MNADHRNMALIVKVFPCETETASRNNSTPSAMLDTAILDLDRFFRQTLVPKIFLPSPRMPAIAKCATERSHTIVDKIAAKMSTSQSVAVVHNDATLSYRDLFDEVEQLSKRLLESDFFSELEQKEITPRIAVLLPNGLDYILVALSILKTGACFIPVPDELAEPERRDLLDRTSCHAIISAQDLISDALVPPDSSVALPSSLVPTELLISQLHPEAADFCETAFSASGPAFIRFSSGTTSECKGVVISHDSLLERIQAANEGLQIKPGTSVLWTLPMAHHFAVSIILYLYYGATTIVEVNRDPDKVMEAARKYKAEVLYGSPFHYNQLAHATDVSPLPHLRLAVATAFSLSAETAELFLTKFDCSLVQALGIIEIGLPVINLKAFKENPTALGQVQSAYDWRISPLNGNPNHGELLIRGPGMFDAYLSPWKTRDAITDSDGWFATGDVVTLAGDGETLSLAGRTKSVINTGGMKVFPEEIESVLNTHPAISRSRVIAFDHPIFGTLPQAEYELNDAASVSEKELQKFCSGKLTAYKVPFRFQRVTSVSTTANGKISRRSNLSTN